MTFHVPNALRVRTGRLASDDLHENNGVFVLPHFNPASKLKLTCIASDGCGWEHVSVSLRLRTPSWDEMTYVKMIFWDAEDTVVQYHPPQSEWVNNHPHCLHLWRPVGVLLPAPPAWMVGDAKLGTLKLAGGGKAA